MGCLVGLENDVILCMTAHIYIQVLLAHNLEQYFVTNNTNVCVFIIKSFDSTG